MNEDFFLDNPDIFDDSVIEEDINDHQFDTNSFDNFGFNSYLYDDTILNTFNENLLVQNNILSQINNNFIYIFISLGLIFGSLVALIFWRFFK